MKNYQVLISEEAEKDLEGIFLYVAQNDSPEKAFRLLDKLEQTCAKLESFPDRGHVPKELDRIAITRYLEIYYKPYRIIYEIINNQVFVLCIIDGHRDIESVLTHRLLRI